MNGKFLKPSAKAVSAREFRLDSAEHRNWLKQDAKRQFDFFRPSLNPLGGFYALANDGIPLEETVQELHTTARLVHSYSLGKLAGVSFAFGDDVAHLRLPRC